MTERTSFKKNIVRPCCCPASHIIQYNLENCGHYITHDCSFVDFTEPISFTGEVQPERKGIIQVRFQLILKGHDRTCSKIQRDRFGMRQKLFPRVHASAERKEKHVTLNKSSSTFMKLNYFQNKIKCLRNDCKRT